MVLVLIIGPRTTVPGELFQRGAAELSDMGTSEVTFKSITATVQINCWSPTRQAVTKPRGGQREGAPCRTAAGIRSASAPLWRDARNRARRREERGDSRP